MPECNCSLTREENCLSCSRPGPVLSSDPSDENPVGISFCEGASCSRGVLESEESEVDPETTPRENPRTRPTNDMILCDTNIMIVDEYMSCFFSDKTSFCCEIHKSVVEKLLDNFVMLDDFVMLIGCTRGRIFVRKISCGAAVEQKNDEMSSLSIGIWIF